MNTSDERPGTIIQIFSDREISSYLFSHLSPKEFLRISRTCKEGKVAVSAYFVKAFDVNARLERFFSNPLAFRFVQAQTSTLISGSFALQFFDRTSYVSSDLDLYLHLEHRRTMGRWLLHEAGYSFSPYRGQEQDFESAVLRKNPRRGFRYSMPGVADILTFVKTQTDGTKLKVQLIIARRTPMEVILGFHSSEFSDSGILFLGTLR